MCSGKQKTVSFVGNQWLIYLTHIHTFFLWVSFHPSHVTFCWITHTLCPAAIFIHVCKYMFACMCERERDWVYRVCDVRAPFMNIIPPPPPPPVRLHYIAANAIQGTTWGSLPPFPSNQSSLLNSADPSDATRLSGHAHMHAHGHPPQVSF